MLALPSQRAPLGRYSRRAADEPPVHTKKAVKRNRPARELQALQRQDGLKRGITSDAKSASERAACSWVSEP